ncbi:MAG TPA: UDP-galactopyranose mutase [Burkholderiales bacterium]|nr:UDP-galactopyranose mutase [Burkholderiales bacterium]
MKLDVLVVGAGFSGAVIAERLADSGLRVLVIDKRPHIGGNAYDRADAHGVLVHPYGPHIFHTNSARIFDYLSVFTTWRPYEHRVRAKVDGQLVPIPINIDTVNRLYGLDLDETTIQAFYDSVREPRDTLKTSEDVVLNAVGRDLYEKFFRGYTLKQWGLDPSQLSASVAARIPTRVNRDDRYFTDQFQFMPRDGYTALFEALLSHPRIRVEVGVDFFSMRRRFKPRHIVFTGPIDRYFDYGLGRLPYRSLEFRHEHHAGVERLQPVGTVNYPNEADYTRITEFKHLTGQVHAGTSVVREYPCDEGDPYYPVPRPENEALYKQYEALAERETDVTFAGRLAQYRYYNMDQCVGGALKAAEKLIARLRPAALTGRADTHRQDEART